MEDFSSAGQLVILGLVDSSIGAMAKGLVLVDVEPLIAKEMLLSLGHSIGHYSNCRSNFIRANLILATCTICSE